MNETELKILAKNLANPEGEKGLEIADMMHATNISMTLESIKAMALQDLDSVLEIGQGNAGHLEFVLNSAKNLQYIGLDISETMKNAAAEKNTAFKNQAQFLVYNGRDIPFEDHKFDKIFTVNTLYFWEKPLDFLNEIFRVLKPEGIFVLTFGQKEFMQNLSFTEFGFNLYDNQNLIELLQKSHFSNYVVTEKEELIKSKTGELVTRIYTILTIKK